MDIVVFIVIVLIGLVIFELFLFLWPSNSQNLKDAIRKDWAKLTPEEQQAILEILKKAKPPFTKK